MLRKILRFGPVVDATRWGIKIRFEIRFGRLKILRFDSIFDLIFFFSFKIRFEDSVESSNLTNLKIRESYDSTITGQEKSHITNYDRPIEPVKSPIHSE